ncbi:MAG: hypothetical protein UDO63_04710 [Oscillospiraceae bacterium]
MLIKGRKVYNPDNSYLLEYHARIETGEIIVGQELWQELENLREDFYLLSKSACIKSTIYCDSDLSKSFALSFAKSFRTLSHIIFICA